MFLIKFKTYYNSNPTKTKTGEVISELNLAKDAMISNMEKLLQRDFKLTLIATKSDNLQGVSQNISKIV
jgi:hypothetical protein